jgi:hypothetical protein
MNYIHGDIFLNLLHFFDIKILVKMSMTNKTNNKLISKFINNNFINANVFNLTYNDIMFIPKFIEYLFNSKCVKEHEHLNKLVKQDRKKDKAFYRFYKNPSILTLSLNTFKFHHSAKYMNFAIKKDISLFRFCSKDIRYQDDLGRKAIDADINNFPCVSYRLRNNKHYAKLAVQHNGLFLEYTNKQRNNKEICLIAVKQNIESVKYIGFYLKNDEDFMKEISLLIFKYGSR